MTPCNGREGLSRLDEVRPALILLDLIIPQMDGFEFSGKLRQRPGCEHLSVSVITAKMLTADGQRLGEVRDMVESKDTNSPT